MAKIQITQYKLTEGRFVIHFMSEFMTDEILVFYLNQGLLRCRNKHMSREFIQAVLAKIGEHLILDGI